MIFVMSLLALGEGPSVLTWRDVVEQFLFEGETLQAWDEIKILVQRIGVKLAAQKHAHAIDILTLSVSMLGLMMCRLWSTTHQRRS